MNISTSKTTKITLLVTCLVTACVKSKPVKDPVRPSVPAKATPAEIKPAETDLKIVTPAAPAAAPQETQSPPETKKLIPTLAECDTSLKFNDNEPTFLPHTKVFITRIMSPCLNGDGKPGHRKNAGYMAMGFPCTGGEGRIDWKGTNYNRPKMVSFLLETSCPMSPNDKAKIQAEAGQVLGISKDASFIAFNPFMVQYWEIPEYNEADTGINVDLRTGKALDEGWTNFIKPKPMRILLVGRENAWVPGNFMYAVEGDLLWASKNRFSLRVDKARLLHGEELDHIKKRCDALKPARDCSKVF